MELSGERLIKAPRQKVWDALQDPATLKACIPGCETIEKISKTEMKATAAVKLGTNAARLNAKLLLSDLDPPNGYTISAAGQGDGADFTSGKARVTLTDEAGATRLGYTLTDEIIGESPGATARQYVDSFFTRFAAIVAPTPRPGPVLETAGAQLAADGVPPAPITPGLEDVPAAAPAVPHDPAAHVAHPAPFHPPPHEDHDHDPSNPHYFGLPVGVIIAGTVAAISVGITLLKFIG